MPNISKVQLPSGGVYDIKDTVAREMISGGVSFIIAWNGRSVPNVAEIPAGVTVVYENTLYTGTLAANSAQAGAFYLVATSTAQNEYPGNSNVDDYYDEYVVVSPKDGGNTKTWEKIGDTQVNLHDIVKGVQVGDNLAYMDHDTGIVTITWANMVSLIDDHAQPTIFLVNVSGNNAALFRTDATFSAAVPVEFNTFYYACLSLALQPVYIVQQVSSTDVRYYTIESIEANPNKITLQAIDGNTKYVVTLQDDGDPKLVGTITSSPILSSATLNKQTDVALGESTTFTNAASSVTFSGGSNDKVLGESTTFSLTSGAVTHGTPGTDTVLGTGTTFTVTDPTISLGGTTKYLSASASGGGASWNSKDQKTVVTGYSNPSTDTFVKSVTAETNKNLVTTTVPNVTGNSSVSIPNVTGNTAVSIPNVTSVGSASTWSFTMGSGDDSETLIIGGTNSTTPTLGTALSASKVTLGTALSASKVTLGTAITVATGATSTTGTGDAVVTGVTIGDSATAITGLGTASTATVIGSSSTFTNTQPSISLTANGTSGTGRITYLESASPTASGGAVTASGDNVTAITSMPTSTVGTGITVGTNDKVTAITSIGTGTAAAQTITVGTNDKITVLTSSTDITAE